MWMRIRSYVLVVLLMALYVKADNNFSDVMANREHRGTWIATVFNIDWPLSPTSTVATQQDQMKYLIAQVKRAGLNAVYFQVRPTGDALYISNIEPWSRFLTGEQGRQPSPIWDPLQYLIDICTPLGIEVHAWINPYRGSMSPTTSDLAANHMARVYPQYAYVYSNFIWMDPGAKPVQDRTAQVALDLVTRYNLAGLHLDDYFYPYPVDGWNFPDNNTYAAYLSNGGTMARDDWRRNNVNILIERINREVHIAKPWIKFSVSPFGIYRPGHQLGMPSPPIAGFDQYSQIYCDPILWLHQGWVDILQPQLYWKIDPPAQSYPILLNWWVGSAQNPKVRHVMAGNYLSRIDVDDWPLDELKRQVDISREPQHRSRGSTGNVMYSSKMFRDNFKGATDFFTYYVYPEPALQPEFPWLAAAYNSSIPDVVPKTEIFSNGRLYIGLDEREESKLIVQIAIYKLNALKEWRLFKVYSLSGPVTDKNAGVELENGHYIATFVDRFGREGTKTHFKI